MKGRRYYFVCPQPFNLVDLGDMYQEYKTKASIAIWFIEARNCPPRKDDSTRRVNFALKHLKITKTKEKHSNNLRLRPILIVQVY